MAKVEFEDDADLGEEEEEETGKVHSKDQIDTPLITALNPSSLSTVL